MPIYYIDNINGCDENDGLSPESAKLNYEQLDIRPGDTLLFRCETIHRGKLKTWAGAEGAWVTYGAYGEGELPKFCGSTDVSDPADWVEIEPNIWECKKAIPGEVGNFEFDINNCSATFHWTRDELCAQGDFWDSRIKGEALYGLNDPVPEQQVLLYSVGNPATVYSHIECISWNTRVLAEAKPYNRYESLHFRNSGIHAIAGAADHVQVVDCMIENIGGCAWNNELQIRLGNGVEFYGFGSYILVEGCVFKNIYDSCVTHQGPGEKTQPAEHFICRNNIFDTYGMAAFEYRDKLPIDSSFTGNTCLNAGCGFAMLGEELPRYSEIWPQPMGHHIFMWRIDHATEGGNLVIEDNVFGPAPVGAAMYSIISPEAEAQTHLDNNKYTQNDILLNRWGGENFNDLEAYKAKTGEDKNSTYLA